MKTIRLQYMVLAIIILFAGCRTQTRKTLEKEQANTIQHKKEIDFDGILNGRKIELIRITNANGITASFTNYGQRLVSLLVPDKNGKLDDVVLGFNTLEGYLSPQGTYFGCIIGRYGNRIAKGNFELDGVSYPLAENNNGNHLHGGIQGFHAVVWDVTDKNDNTVEFTRISPDMEEGYPGNLKVKVQYTLTDANELVMRYSAETDAPTVVNLTHHSFFNLKGEGEGDILDHVLQINADYFTPVDAGSIPLGEIRPVVDTPYDFNSPKAIGARIEVEDAQLQIGKGYDINYVLNDTPLTNEGLVFAAKVTSPSTGRVMEVFTNEPGIQLYTGNYLDGTAIGKSGRPYLFRGAICLETQHFPDSPNKKDFPSTVLRPGQTYGSSCIYKFSTLP